MFIDKRLQVSTQQVLSAAAPSTDSIDLGLSGPGLGTVNRIIGPGEPLWLVVAARTALVGTLAVSIQTDDNPAFSSPATPFTSQTFLAAEVPAGKILIFPMVMTNERHLRVSYGGAPTGGTFDAWFTSMEPQTWAAQPDAILP